MHALCDMFTELMNLQASSVKNDTRRLTELSTSKWRADQVSLHAF